jgi:hypothetical protein
MLFLIIGADKINKAFTLKPTIINLLLGLNLHLKPTPIRKYLPRNNIPSPKHITRLRSILINLLGHNFPKALITGRLALAHLLLQIILHIIEGGRHKSLVFGVLEVDDVVGFYLLL